jgi:hypothetical protein
MMNREQQIRDIAYGIWQAEGRPDGRDRAHWQQAEEQLQTATATDGSTKKRSKVTRTVGAAMGGEDAVGDQSGAPVNGDADVRETVTTTRTSQKRSRKAM